MNLGGVGWATDDQHRPRPSLRSQIELLTDLLAENETGLLITLDEIHHHQKDELREFGATVQHAFRRHASSPSQPPRCQQQSTTCSTTPS